MAVIVPSALLSSLEGVPGFNKESFVFAHDPSSVVTSVRINPLKHVQGELQFSFADPVKWSSLGFYLPYRPSFTLDPLFHAGAYYVQEASSMFLEQAIRQSVDLSQPLKVLDLCAAPGGKSTLILSLLNTRSVLVSNEIIKQRVSVLEENLTKWGNADVVVTNNSPADYKRLPGFFDLMVVDAPCSGSGLFRKDQDAIEEWSPANVQMCYRRQKDILMDALPSLKEGGILIYSTCSFSVEENEDIGEWLTTQNMEGLGLELHEEWNIVETTTKSLAYGYRFYPDKVKGEGFFLSVFRKASNEPVKKENTRFNLATLSPGESAGLQPWFGKNEEISFYKYNNEILALPDPVVKILPWIQKNLYIKKAGIKAGSLIRHELLPDHSLAMSSLLSEEFPSTDIDENNALQYLRRRDMDIHPGKLGWNLTRYKGLALGWIKVLTNRINNYYPKEWRILNK